MSFLWPDVLMVGLAEREDTLWLKNTDGVGKESLDKPYELFSMGVTTHPASDPQAMYGSVPYIFGLSSEFSIGLAWINSARTFIDINKSAAAEDSGRLTSFVSDSGALEFFVFATQKTSESE